MIARADITGLVLAGGRGTRMGGVDKGLQLHRGRPLAGHAAARLAAQVGAVAISANRNLDAYASLGVPVWTDAIGGFAGPLAGILTGLLHCPTPFLAVVPCDAPLLADDLVARLARPFDAAEPIEVAVAATQGDSGPRIEATFCLLRRELAADLQEALERGERKGSRWLATRAHAVVVFEDAGAFTNVNTAADLRAAAGLMMSALPPLGRP